MNLKSEFSTLQLPNQDICVVIYQHQLDQLKTYFIMTRFNTAFSYSYQFLN